MKNLLPKLIVLALLPVLSCSRTSTLDSLSKDFEAPPMEYRPYVWWHWMGSNFTKEGIKADLEAMKEEGIAGATIFNLASAVQETHEPIGNNPHPEKVYRGKEYWEAVAYAAGVAQELGLKIGIHNSPGYSTTGGPWIKEEDGMQRVVSSETAIAGGRHVRITLPAAQLPEYRGWGATGRRATFYKDIAVMAVPDKGGAADVLDISAYMDSNGVLNWDAPAGRWTVVRLGHAPTLSNPHPLPDELIGKALEADKMNKAVSEKHWDEVLSPLKEHVGRYIGKSFTHVLIDSYEAGDQNWTPGFREAFKEIKGYDPLPWFALKEAGKDVEGMAHFDADLASVISRLYIDNGWKTAARKVHEAGLKLYWEPYWGPFDMEESVGIADVPMGEFWSEGDGSISYRIVDAASRGGQNIVGAEAFTGSPENSRFNEDPESLKHSADGAFLSGVNLMFLHHWVHQPFDDRYQPGMGMGWWGTHFGRNQTWFKPGKAFMTYLSRCQMMLRQGELVGRGKGWIHRHAGDAEIYFVANQDSTLFSMAFPYAEGAAVPELWDPYSGKITSAPYLVDGKRLRIELEGGKSVFLVVPMGKTSYKKEAPFIATSSEEKPVEIKWTAVFEPKLDAPFTIENFTLQDLSKSTEDRLRYFSGTVTFYGNVEVDAVGKDQKVLLDFGNLYDIASLKVNGKEAGVLWYPPFRADVTSLVKAGENLIELAVSVNWANRLIGDERQPADFEWGTDRGESRGRAMKAFPDWFIKDEKRPSEGRKGFVIWSYFREDSELEKAGLVGPVKMVMETCNRTGDYKDPTLPVEKRAEDLLSKLSTEEKVQQASAQLLFMDEFYDKRDYSRGHVRNVGHFLPDGGLPNNPANASEKINEDTRKSIEANRWGIPVLQHGEALHGAQWGNATCFPQSIGMGATFDEDLYYKVGRVVAEELRAVGVRMVYAPVINITRDQRWGRGQESYGEDVLLNSRMGLAYVKALEDGNVVATPKHFVDNYGEGGHDSFASQMSWRALREVYLEPFRAAVEEGGARGVMSAYNSVDGIPASCNPELLQDILKKEWGFEGFVISDYGAVEIVAERHKMAENEDEALALCLENGLDVQEANTSAGLLDLVKAGKVSEKTLDEVVRRVLKVKIGLGLLDNPFTDPEAAEKLVRCPAHRELAYEAACKAMTLLKNDGILPLKPGSVRRIGVFGPAATQINVGDYSGGRGGWKGDGVTPYEGLKKAFEGSAEVVLNQSAGADVLIFFPTITEEEGSDRSSFLMPSAHQIVRREEGSALIIADRQERIVEVDQEKMVRQLIDTGKPVIVVLHNGAVIDISDWVDGTAAVLEAWYSGEQGGRAIADAIIGKYSPGGRLPMSWVRSIGQNPYYYSIKPSGRGYGYVENDGSPLYPFGYGLSYTTFEYSDFQMPERLEAGEALRISVNVTNTGSMAADEVVQVYAHDEIASVARPMKELVAFTRLHLLPGESRRVYLEVPYERFTFYDAKMEKKAEEGWYEVWLGKNASERITGSRVYVNN